MPVKLLALCAAAILSCTQPIEIGQSVDNYIETKDAGIVNQLSTCFMATVTSYSELDSCHYPNCIMASGKRAYVGAVACPRDIPLGTKVTIDGSEYTCEDKTALRYNGRYDIFQGWGEEGHNKAIKFGKQELLVCH